MAETTLHDVWRLLGTMNKRFDGFERQFVELREDMANLRADFGRLEARVTTQIGALKESIEARDFRLDEHGRRLTDLENPRT